MRRFLFLLLLATLWSEAGAQVPDIIRRLPRGGGGGGAPRSGSDTSGSGFERRNRFEDSLTITYRLLDSTRTYYLDTTINEFRQNPVPPTFLYLGNIGAPARSLLFTPKATTGWDPGFHAYDAYRWRLADTRFFNTTRPYTELGFVLGAGQQQMLEVLHTQNVKPHWNAAFQYRLINAPGFFSNQQAKHNNYQITSWYQSP
ncbi:MAG TPA: putative porin, partial [Chitinophagaceae bacterium]|nr:putative porin [Chitinophagaceae bacterium]